MANTRPVAPTFTGPITTSQVGLENRSEILPQPNIPTDMPGIFGPDYSFADNVPLPSKVGVVDGNSIESVINAVKGAAYYIDTIGFGASSSSLTSGMGVRPLGVNTFTPTGFTCANGANMWMYMEGIPTGNALGKRLANGLKAEGLPPMRGLAPGILEDAENALDPNPMISAVFGTGYPNCKYVTKQVGDQDRKIRNPATGNYYVNDPESVINTGGVPTQGRWVHDGDLTMDQYNAVPKNYCPNGYPKVNHKDSDCLKPLLKRTMSGFKNYESAQCTCHKKESPAVKVLKMVGIAAGVLITVGLIHKMLRKSKN